MATWPPPLLDDFTGANGSIDGRVAGAYVWEAPALTAAAAEIASNVLAGSAGANRSGGLTATLDDQQMAAVTITNTPTSGNGYIYLRVQGALPTVSAGHFRAVPIIGAGAADDEVRVTQQSTAGADLVIVNGTGTGFDWAAGDAYGCWVLEEGAATRVNAYRKASGGSWELVGTATTATATRPFGGHVVLRQQFTAMSFDDFLFQEGDVVPVTPAASDDPPIGMLGRGAGW